MAPPTTKPATKGKGDALDLVRKHPAGLAIAGGAALGLFVLLRSKTNANNNATTPTYTADTTGTDIVNTIQPQIDALAHDIAMLGSNQPTSSTPTTTPTSTTPAKTVQAALTPPPKGSGQVLVIGGSAPGLYGPGQVAPKDGSAVCQGTTCLTPKDFNALGAYLDSLRPH